MIRLDATTRKLQAVLAGAVTTNQLPCTVSYSDKTSTDYVGATQLTNTNSTTAVDICAAPGASTVRDIDYLSIRNRDTAAATVTVMLDDNGTDYEIVKAALAVGDSLIYTHGDGWRTVDSFGQVKSGFAVPDGDKGDITVSSSGTVWTVDNDAITYAKMQNVSATDKLLGRSTAGSGDVEEIACTAFARSILDDADEATFKATVNLEIGTDVQAYDADLSAIAALAKTDGNIIVGDGATWVAESGATARTSLGLGTGDSPQFTGVNLGHASDTTLTRVSAGVVAVEGTNVVLAGAVTTDGITMSTARLLGRTTAATGAVEEITVGSGLTLSAGSLTATGGGTGDVVGPASATANSLARFDGTTGKLLKDGAVIGTDVASLAANTFTGVQRWAKGADVASASALTLGTDGNYFDITGTTTITSIGSLGVGTWVKLHFDGALTLTHHATDLVLAGAANITTAAGDEIEFAEYASGDWRMVGGVKADGTAWVGGGANVAVAGTFALSGDISPSQITADQNDYNPTGLSSASTLRLTSDASRNVTGLQGGADGRVLVLHNVGSNNIVLKDDSASSTAGNRFALSADITLGVDQAAVLQYDSTSSRWRCFALPAASSSSGLVGVTTFSSNGTWTKPGGCTKIVAMAVGGGGAGGGASGASTVESWGDGGKAGAVNWGYTASPEASYAITIGAGGTGVSGANGNDGSTTSVGALLSASGGRGGDTFQPLAVSTMTTYVGGGGQSCLSSGGARQTGAGAGNAASANTGAGGGGARDYGASNRAGGAGGSGYVIIWEFA